LPRLGRSTGDVVKAVNAEIERFLAGHIEADELARAKTRLIASNVYARDNQKTLAYAYGSGLTTGLTAREVHDWPDRVRAVTAEDVLAAAHAVLDAQHAVTGELLPAAKPIQEARP
jgi:zinc protease